MKTYPSNEKMLKAVIEKADHPLSTDIYEDLLEEYEAEGWDLEDALSTGYRKDLWFLFSHYFAKAFFGEVWMHHLQQCVISPSPLQYYFDHI